ncbi:MAG: heme-binding protein [Xanthobacteraceae bacterium]
MRALSLDEANTIIAATFAAAKKHKCRPMSAIVLDAGGRVKAFQKEDNASMLRFEVCYGKAYASLALGRPSKLVLQKADEKPLFMRSVENLADYPLFLEGGGQLIRDKSGEVIAAIGVTGDANEMDDICAIAGIHTAGYCADSDFFADRERMRSLSIHKSVPLVDPRPNVARPNAARARAARTKRQPAGRGNNGARVPGDGSSRSRGA